MTAITSSAPSLRQRFLTEETVPIRNNNNNRNAHIGHNNDSNNDNTNNNAGVNHDQSNRTLRTQDSAQVAYRNPFLSQDSAADYNPFAALDNGDESMRESQQQEEHQLASSEETVEEAFEIEGDDDDATSLVSSLSADSRRRHQVAPLPTATGHYSPPGFAAFPEHIVVMTMPPREIVVRLRSGSKSSLLTSDGTATVENELALPGEDMKLPSVTVTHDSSGMLCSETGEINQSHQNYLYQSSSSLWPPPVQTDAPSPVMRRPVAPRSRCASPMTFSSLEHQHHAVPSNNMSLSGSIHNRPSGANTVTSISWPASPNPAYNNIPRPPLRVAIPSSIVGGSSVYEAGSFITADQSHGNTATMATAATHLSTTTGTATYAGGSTTMTTTTDMSPAPALLGNRPRRIEQRSASATLSVGSLVGQSSWVTAPTTATASSASVTVLSGPFDDTREYAQMRKAQRKLRALAAQGQPATSAAVTRKQPLVTSELKYMWNRVATPIRRLTKTEEKAALQRSSGCLT